MTKEKILSGTIAAYFSGCVFQNISPNTKRGVQHLDSADPKLLGWDGGGWLPV